MEFDFLSFCLYIYIYTRISGASPRNFFGGGGGGLCKSWTFYPGQYSDLSEGATKNKIAENW